jgi:hypothetical protein
MKFAPVLVILLATCFACAPEDAVPNEPIDENFDTSMATLLRGGTIVGVNHTASGTASVYKSGVVHVVVLDPYDSQDGPDLKVYLSKDANGSQYVNLGQLKSTMGKQVYNIPTGVNVDEYKFVLVWCEKFSVLFARAQLN